MLRSMYSGISGMKVNQIKLDVIGNNISNSGTTAFKSSRARFSDMLRQNETDAMAPSMNQGGKNAAQVGLGVQLASIDNVMTQGMMQPTGRSLDVAIDGDGFFIVSKGPSVYEDGRLEVSHRPGSHNITEQSMAGSGVDMMYSRDGAFILDEEGNLLTSDGYRVMGYSLTNDDNGSQATAKNPNNVNTAGLDFRFGPGSQLNGYKVVLGQIGPGTVTSCDVDTTGKLLVVNGDFSTPGALTAKQIESAISKGLSSKGISQTVTVTGKPVNIAELGSSAVAGGADATAPSAANIAGFTLQFTEGSELNGFTFEIGEINKADGTVAEASKKDKKVIINTNLLERGGVTGEELKSAINEALAKEGIKQQVSNVTGSQLSLSNIVNTTDGSGTNAATATIENNLTGATNAGEGTLSGITFKIGEGAGLNGYTIKWGDTTSGIKTEVEIDGKDITINADMTKGDIAASIEAAMKKSFRAANIKTEVSVTGTPSPSVDTTEFLKVGNDGSDLVAPKSVNVGGFTIEFPKGDLFNDVRVEIVNVKSTTTIVEAKEIDGEKVIQISGDFLNSGKVSANDLQSKIEKEAEREWGYKADAAKGSIKVTGSSKIITGLVSEEIDGGLDLIAPGTVNVNGMEFVFDKGGSLNGYKIQIGKITKGTKTDATIDEKNKTIVINGDFTTPGATSAQRVQNAINKALQDKGINQGITVNGKPGLISGTESEETYGGTPVQSIDNDGTINFVDGTGDLKSYDESLKSLKIPDKVKVPGSDEELRVKSYTIDKNGIINGVLEDGRVAALGQIAMASFKNPEGLTGLGKNLYTASVNSGTPTLKSGVGTTGEDNSKGYGDNLQGMLEMSNVDLAEQFTDMIVSSRAFQASGKMITTGDEILQDIINLKR